MGMGKWGPAVQPGTNGDIALVSSCYRLGAEVLEEATTEGNLTNPYV